MYKSRRDSVDSDEVKKKAPLCFSSRIIVVGMCFLMLLNLQSFRLDISVAIVCMVNHTATNLEDRNLSSTLTAETGRYYNTSKSLVLAGSTNVSDVEAGCNDENGAEDEEDKEDGPYKWSKQEQGLILSSYYWGLVPLMIQGGWLVTRFGSVKAVGISSLLLSIITFITPSVATHGYVAMIVLRIVIGFLTTTFIPGVQHLLSLWIPAEEMGLLASIAYSGLMVGVLATFTSSGLLCKYGFAGGWPSVFYTHGIFCLTVTAAWWILVKDNPSTHPRISPGELEYLQLNVANQMKSGKKEAKSIPWKKFLTSRPVQAVFVCAIAIDIQSALSVVFLPTYMAQVMKFKITSNSLWSALPQVFFLVLQILGGVVSDFLFRHTTMSKGTLRRLLICTGQLICAAATFSVGFLGCQHADVAVVLLILSIAPLGFISLGCSVNPIDLAPAYSGIIMSVANFISNSFALTFTAIATAIFSQSSDRESWQVIFSVVAGVVFLTFLFYISFASGELQPWAKQEPELEMDSGVSMSKDAETDDLDNVQNHFCNDKLLHVEP